MVTVFMNNICGFIDNSVLWRRIHITKRLLSVKCLRQY